MLRSISIILILFLSFVCKGQSSDDYIFTSNLLPQVKKLSAKKIFNEEVSHNSNEIEFIFSGLFLIYKDYFSSQDHNSCAFHPSCSLYAIQNVKQNGLIKGGVLALDRLMRCNSFSPEKYVIDYDRRILLDPVK